jgi:hypothetical protein
MEGPPPCGPGRIGKSRNPVQASEFLAAKRRRKAPKRGGPFLWIFVPFRGQEDCARVARILIHGNKKGDAEVAPPRFQVNPFTGLGLIVESQAVLTLTRKEPGTRFSEITVR